MFIQKLQMICCFPMKMCIYGNLIFAFSEAELDRVTCMGNLVSRHCVTYLRVPLDGFSVLCAVGCSYFNCWKPSAAYNPILAFKGNTDYKHERFRVRQTLDANVSLDLLSDITDPTKTAMYISIFSLPIPLLPLPLSKEIMTDLLLSLFLSIFS